jgi:RNA polymerase sigma-70 factor (ECF subfamily)
MASPTSPRAQSPSSLPASPKASAAGLGGANPTLGAETQLLRRADQALRIGDPARALELLDEHARTFPEGVLAEERSAERVTTLCTLGRVNQARSEAVRFLAIHADSPLAKVVRRSCGGGGLGDQPGD